MTSTNAVLFSGRGERTSDCGSPMVAVACGTAGWPGDLFRVSSPPRLGSRAPSQAAMPAVLSGSTVTALGRPPYRAREGHGQHLQLRSLVSDPDDRNADHLGLDAARRAFEPPVTVGRERPNGFKSIRSSRVTAAAALAFRHSGWLVSQDSSRVYPAPGLRMPPVCLGLAWPCDLQARGRSGPGPARWCVRHPRCG